MSAAKHTPFLPNTAQNVIHRPNSVEILSNIDDVLYDGFKAFETALPEAAERERK